MGRCWGRAEMCLPRRAPVPVMTLVDHDKAARYQPPTLSASQPLSGAGLLKELDKPAPDAAIGPALSQSWYKFAPTHVSSTSLWSDASRAMMQAYQCAPNKSIQKHERIVCMPCESVIFDFHLLKSREARTRRTSLTRRRTRSTRSMPIRSAKDAASPPLSRSKYELAR